MNTLTELFQKMQSADTDYNTEASKANKKALLKSLTTLKNGVGVFRKSVNDMNMTSNVIVGEVVRVEQPEPAPEDPVEVVLKRPKNKRQKKSIIIKNEPGEKSISFK